MAAWAGRGAAGYDWARPPVVNACTRLTVEMCPADGSLAVAGWEANESGSAQPVTALTRI
jgi:hypothetical protein